MSESAANAANSSNSNADASAAKAELPPPKVQPRRASPKYAPIPSMLAVEAANAGKTADVVGT